MEKTTFSASEVQEMFEEIMIDIRATILASKSTLEFNQEKDFREGIAHSKGSLFAAQSFKKAVEKVMEDHEIKLKNNLSKRAGISTN